MSNQNDTDIGRTSSRRRAAEPTPIRRAPIRAIRVHRGTDTVSIALHPERQYTFGRGHNADVLFDEDRVSRQHGTLRHDGEDWFFIDLGSANGTFLCHADDAIQMEQQGDELPVTSLVSGTKTFVSPGEALLLGTRRAFVEFLATLPEGALHARTRAETVVSAASQTFEKTLSLVSQTQLPVFLLGPSGVGKSSAAREIHRRSACTGEFVSINCARLPTDASALHSELLGHVAGAFTGAGHARKGRFFAADEGTIFLDEVESLPEIAQGFLLDLLDRNPQLLPLGAAPQAAPPLPRLRLISASKQALAQTGLRADLCERLAEGHLCSLPSLADRKEDIPGLIGVFLQEMREEANLDAAFSDEAIRFAQEQEWPGQIRQLRGAVRALVQGAHARGLENEGPRKRLLIHQHDLAERVRQRALAFGGAPAPEVAPAQGQTAQTPTTRVWSMHRPINPRALTDDDIRDALLATGNNRTEAAALLGIARNTLLAKIRKMEATEK